MNSATQSHRTFFSFILPVLCESVYVHIGVEIVVNNQLIHVKIKP